VAIVCLGEKEIARFTEDDLLRNARAIVNVCVALLVIVELFVTTYAGLSLLPTS
jgi:hypothetical protein